MLQAMFNTFLSVSHRFQQILLKINGEPIRILLAQIKKLRIYRICVQVYIIINNNYECFMIKTKILMRKQNQQQSDYQQISQKQNMPRFTQTKQDKLKQKKSRKRDEQIQKSLKLISQKKFEEALQLIKTLVLESQDLQNNKFAGLGFKQDWDEYLPDGPLDWFAKSLQNGQLSKNPFDLLSLCFMPQLYFLKVSFKQEFFEFYDQVAQKEGQCVQIYVGRGHLFYANKRFFEAEKQYLQALKLIKDNQKIYECLGWIKALKFDSWRLGKGYIEKCLELNPNNLGALYVRAYCQPIDQKKLQYYNQIIQRDSEYYKAYIGLSQLQQNFQTKCKWLQQALNCNPKSILTIHCLAEAKHRFSGYISQATNMIQKLCGQNPSEAQNYFVLGVMIQQINEDYSISCAVQNYQKCLELNPYHLQAIERLAEIYAGQDNDYKNNSQAVTLYKRYVQLNPYNCQVFNNLGLALNEQGLKFQAKFNYEKAIQVNDKFFQAYLNLGRFYKEKENYTEALDYYYKAESIQNNSAILCYNIAICYFWQKRYYQSQKWADKCCNLGADDCIQVYELLGDINFSMEDYLNSLKYYLQHSVVLKQLRTQYIMQNLINRISKTQALQLLDAAHSNVKNDEKSYYWYYQLGKLHQELQDLEGAIKNYWALKKLQLDKQIHYKYRDEIQCIFGENKSIGVISMFDSLRISLHAKNYWKRFSQIYAMNQNNIMISQ